MASILAAADELATCTDGATLLRRAVELARERVGLERVGLFLRDPGARSILLRGTWGTGACGETLDEHGLCHECSPDDCQALCQIQEGGTLWIYHHPVPAAAEDPTTSTSRRRAWVVVTPLVHARKLVGVMYNDAALTQAPMDEAKQAHAAVFCSLIAGLVGTRHATCPGRAPVHATGATRVERVLDALERDPLVSGERLAREIGISPGHLARCFKLEMGMSLVDYRNRLRMQRFAESMRRRGGTTLLGAAREAGFGSYAQFHRVFHRLFGMAPRESLGQHPPENGEPRE